MPEILNQLSQLSQSNLFASSLVILVAILVLHGMDKLYSGYRTKFGLARGEKGTAVQAAYGAFRVLIVAAAFFSVLQINGIDVTSLLAGVGLVSAFIALAVQDFLKDIVMGMRMLTDRFFAVGDVVQYGSFEGVVTEFDIRCTKIRALADGRILTVCNRNISEIAALPKEVSVSVTIPLPLSVEPEQIRASFETAAAPYIASGDISGFSYAGITEILGTTAKHTFAFRCPAEKKNGCRAALYAAAAAQLRNDGLLRI